MDENKVFDEEIDEGEDVILTLEMEDGTTEDCIVLSIFPMDDQQYIALLPAAQADDEDGDVYLHLHASFGLSDMTVRGGHLNSCRISGTCEMFVRELPGTVGRMHDQETGLNVFSFGRLES